FVNQVNNILNLFPTPSTCFPKSEGPVARPQSESEWKKLKKYLKSRQSQVKTIEDKLKKREKQILNQLRSAGLVLSGGFKVIAYSFANLCRMALGNLDCNKAQRNSLIECFGLTFSNL
ncbi:unnamed protein product, partial [Allacma fusca]